MAIFAEVRDGFIVWIGEAEENMYADSALDVRDITNVLPLPQQGWKANADGTYSPVPLPPQLPPTVMSRLAFRSRFTEAEQVALEVAMDTNPNPQIRGALRVFDKNLSDANEVDLNDPRTQLAINRLVTFTLLTPQRAAEILDPTWTPA